VQAYKRLSEQAEQVELTGSMLAHPDL